MSSHSSNFGHLDHLALLGDGERRLDVVAGHHDGPDLGLVELLDRRLRLLLDPRDSFNGGSTLGSQLYFWSKIGNIVRLIIDFGFTN
jgi:hypothetical protein